MRERPILFSAPMIRALNAGTKTQTRRVIRDVPERADRVAHIALMPPKPDGRYEELWWAHGGDLLRPLAGPEYWPGLQLWVRETHYRWTGTAGMGGPPSSWRRSPDDDPYQSRGYADYPDLPGIVASGACVTVPSIFMPRWASRITLEVTEVRVQRLQDIREADAKAEGVTEPMPIMGTAGYVAAFSYLWDSINGKRWPWEGSNPWVWAITFRRLDGQ